MSDTDTLNDAYTYVHGLVTADPDTAIAVQKKYADDKVRDLLGASAGVLLGSSLTVVRISVLRLRLDFSTA